MVKYLDDTVEEVKENIRNADNVDYEELLKKEEEGKNRKTVVEFLEQKIGEEVEEEMHKSEEEKVEEELVDEIEEETSDGLLGSFTRSQVLAGGALFGLLAGLIVGAVAFQGASTGDIGPQRAQQTVQDLLTQSGSNATVSEAEKVNGLYRVNLTQQVTQGNQTTSQSQTYYVTLDGEKLIPSAVQTAFGQPRPVILDVDDIRESIQQRQEQQSQNQTGNTTQ